MNQFIAKLLGWSAAPRVSVGSDIVWVPDIKASAQRFGERYLRFIFTPGELTYCQSAPGDASYLGLAARFAAKEATMKLLRPARDELLPWRSIEIVRNLRGATELVLHGAAKGFAAAAGIEQLTVSLSHDRDYATAVVVAVSRP